ncbi:MAG TPA: hypothetical protein VFN10_13765 [Thermoanaerobaculia bacterium]|nr:hypothetical protein [Thermoanaerobaculia bacterium]
MHDNLVQYFKQRKEIFPHQRNLDLVRFLSESVAVEALPVPAKIFLVDELKPHSYGFPLSRTPALDELEEKARKWLAEEIALRGGNSPGASRSETLLYAYREQLIKLARNALQSSILADYHAVFWLLHTQQLARIFTAFPRQALTDAPKISRDEAEKLKYALFAKWSAAVREALPELTAGRERGDLRASETGKFLDRILENPLIATEEYVGNDLRELRSYFTGYLRRDFNTFKKSFDDLRQQAADLLSKDKLLRRSMALIGYPDTVPHFLSLLDPRVQQLLADHPLYRAPADLGSLELISARVIEYLVVLHLRRGIVWMRTTEDGENVGEDGSNVAYSRAIRPMNFGRRGVVEPIVYRYGLVYDITSFTQTLGEIARGGRGEEQSSYRQMLEFQRELADITRRWGLQFEKFLGDGAFYTSRRATRTVQAAIAIQQFYSATRRAGFAFNKGMRIALNYGYYRLLPMQVSSDGTQIMEFYGPGIVELSRLTTGKATKELEDIQHLLLSHGYDQSDVYRFFAPLSRGVDRLDAAQQEREFYAYVNENGHLINEGIVVSIPFLRQLSTELQEDEQKIYRLRTPWSVYLGFPSSDTNGYLGIRLLGQVSLKGIGMQDVGEIVHVRTDDAEVSILEESRSLLHLLQQEQNRSAARNVGVVNDPDSDSAADLVVCESHVQGDGDPVILVGEWDPVSEEVRRPIRLDGGDAERYGLAIPLTAEVVESQSIAYQRLYQKLSRLETLPSFSVGAIRDNQNFSGFIIGATVEPL